MTMDQGGCREGGCRRRTPAEKLAQLCDADLRTTDPELRLLSGAVTAGELPPDPYASRRAFEDLLHRVRGYLRTQPSARSVHAAGQRLQRAIGGVTADVAKEVSE
ncbi:hypothetical protein [Streptacidiphilus carbonis]|uniref:hypothetical protein n=1 Tax=Streptacidiphilus carbonis TaxID=105422 RepID=UPI0005A883B4|nr:hypothetical protein [Streptacidiphilus carbonis]